MLAGLIDNFAVWLVLGLIGAVCVLLVVAANAIERRYNRTHPPDDWDGMREDKDNGDSSK